MFLPKLCRFRNPSQVEALVAVQNLGVQMLKLLVLGNIGLPAAARLPEFEQQRQLCGQGCR
jgi:hypothetical protein